MDDETIYMKISEELVDKIVSVLYYSKHPHETYGDIKIMIDELRGLRFVEDK